MVQEQNPWPGQMFVQQRWGIFWNCNILEYWFLAKSHEICSVCGLKCS